jgi:predicted PurR-regulated permease PerM
MPLAKPSNPPSRFVTLVTIVVVIAVLRVAEEITIPLALALLLAFLLSPLVVRLSRWLPRAVAIALTVCLAFSVVTTAAWLISNQAVALLRELPRYESNLREKVAALKQPQAAGSWARTIATIERMEADLFRPFAGSPAPAADGRHAPVPVEVRPANHSPVQLTGAILSGLFRPLSTAAIVIVFVIAILFQQEDLRNRFIRVVSGGQLNTATEAVDDAAQRVSRYLLAQLVVNTCFGLCIGSGLALIGVPHAALWGLVATVLRFIPFLGPVMAASFPLLLGIAVDPGWSMVAWTAALFVATEVLTNYVVEVWIYGASTGISTLALLTAAVFWSWLWGLPGLFLSTPLTVCLLVIGQYVPGLKFLGVLLGSEPPLDPAAQFYQRMLSMQQEELIRAAEEHIERHSLAAFYDDVFVPALIMAEVDRHSGALAEVRQRFIFEASAELIEDLGQREAAPPPAGPAPRGIIVGVPARDEADELVAAMLTHLLRDAGLAAEAVPLTTPADSLASRLGGARPVVFVSALPPSTLSAAARTCRRVKQANAAARVLVGVWGADPKMGELSTRLPRAGADAIALRLSDAVAQLRQLMDEQPPGREPAGETKATRTLERTEAELTAARPDEAVDTAVREVARAFGVPSALVSVIETDASFWHRPGRTPPDAAVEANGAEDVLAADSFLVVEDVAKDERFAGQSGLTKRGVKFFATAPLRTPSGHRVGNLCVLDTQPRRFSDADGELLRSLAQQLVDAVEPAATTRARPAPAS